MKTITLQHTRTGAIFRWTYKSLTHDQALVRARKALEFQKEDPLMWKELSLEQEAEALAATASGAS